MTPKQIIAKAAAFVRRVPTDKKLHFAAGLIIAGLCSNFLPPLIAVAIAVVIGAAKEVYDRVTGKGTPEFADFLYTSAGAVVWLILYAVLSAIVWAIVR